MVLVLLSPAKTLDFDRRRGGLIPTVPHFQQCAEALAAVLQKMSAARLGKLLDISPKLAELNHARYADFTGQPRSPAIVAFQGDVYRGLNAADLSDADLNWSQNHVAILSGLYGVLQPLDTMQPYRLEMGIKLPTKGCKDLYGYWGNAVTNHLNTLIETNKTTAVIGCASEEYLSVVQTENLAAPFIQCAFKEIKNGKPQIVAIHAKKVRGLMARYVIENRITQPADLKEFNSAGYIFDDNASDDLNYIFIRWP